MIMRFFGLFGIVLIFLGSMGVPMYEHYCSHERLTIHTLFAEADHCEVNVQSRKSSCCTKEESDRPTLQRNKCCSDELKSITLAFNYFEQQKKTPVDCTTTVPQTLQIYIVETSIPDARNVRFTTTSDPPPLTNHERLPLVCCWRL